MRAVILEKYGCTKAMSFRYIDQPSYNEDEVLVKVLFAAVNQQDCHIRAGKLKFFSPKEFPLKLGTDFSGIIEKIGTNIRNFKVGDAVFGSVHYSRSGSYAEYITAASYEIAHKPKTISFEQAAALPLGGLTALQALRNLGNINEGDKVCINGASGGVGSMAVQLAKYYGAQVTAICSGKNCPKCTEDGADYVLDYTKEEIKEQGERFDIFFDVIGNQCFWASKNIITEKGIFVTTSPSPKAMLQCLCTTFTKKKASVILTQTHTEDLDLLAFLTEQGVLNPKTGKIFPLFEADKAQENMDSGCCDGKVLLEI